MPTEAFLTDSAAQAPLLLQFCRRKRKASHLRGNGIWTSVAGSIMNEYGKLGYLRIPEVNLTVQADMPRWRMQGARHLCAWPGPREARWYEEQGAGSLLACLRQPYRSLVNGIGSNKTKRNENQMQTGWPGRNPLEP